MNVELLQELRKRSGASLADCKAALATSEGDINGAIHCLIERRQIPEGHEPSFSEETAERRLRRQITAGDAEAQYKLAKLIFDGQAEEQSPTEHRDLLVGAAEGGVAQAQWALALALMSEAGGEPPGPEVVAWLQKAAEARHKPANRMLGLLHLTGRGVAQDEFKANKLMRAGAEQGSTHTADGVTLGYAARTDQAKRDEDEAFRCFEEAAEMGIPEGQFWYGMLHANDQHKGTDWTHAVNTLELAADQGFGLASFMIGRIYQKAPERPPALDDDDEDAWRDPEKALTWMKRAAEQGWLPAMCAVASAYEKGRGVETDEVQAAHWYHRAGRGGDGLAVIHLAKYIHAGRGTAPDDQQHTAAWHQRAAQLDDHQALLILGMMHDTARGTPYNPTAAVHCYYEAAQRRSAQAMFWMAAAYFAGYGVEANTQHGEHWLNGAAEAGFKCAFAPLGLMRLHGHAIGQDQAAARKWLDEAAQKGHSFARINVACHSLRPGASKANDSIYDTDTMNYARAALMGFDVAQLLYGVLLVDGRGVAADVAAAKRWIEASARFGLPEAVDAVRRSQEW